MPETSSDKIRVMIVDDIAETRQNIAKLLQFEPDFEVVAQARTGKEAVQMAREVSPHVILMDINMPDMDGISASEAIVRDVPTAQIVILSVQSDADYMRRAMLAGARDFLSKPPSGDELVSTIRKLGARAKAEEQKLAVPAFSARGGPGGSPSAIKTVGKLITVYSPKGGVGCTTVAVNMALGLQSDDTPVVLVDGNVQFGDVEVFLDLHAKTSIADLADRVEELDNEFVSSVLAPHPSGIKVLLAPPRPELADEIGEGTTGAARVKKILEFLKRQFAYVVADTSSALSEITLTFLETSDAIVLLATPDIPSIKNASRFFDIMDALDYPPRQIVFVMNRMDKKAGITAAAVEESIKHRVVAQIPLDEKTVMTSINQGVPFILGDRSRPAVQGLYEVIEEVKEALTEPEPEPAPAEKKKATERVRLFGS